MADFLAQGDVVERYRVERLLGAGGMAEVYLVEHVTLHTRHALKVLRLAGPALQDRLHAEGRVQAQLHHPNLVHVIDVLTVQGLPALLMEYVDGPDLNHWIRLVRPDPVLAEQMFRQMVAGVAVAHAAGVVHRDLKPGNVFVAGDPEAGWTPKIGDFGLVKAMSTDLPGHTRAGLPMGTPQYMPPEQIRDAATVDQRADVFALGCVLYELLAHEQAYAGHDLLEIFTKVSDGVRAPLPERVPSALAALVDWCLAIDPADRPQDCAAILRGLDGEVPSLLVAAARTPAGPALPLAPLVVAAALGSVVVLALLVLAIAWIAHPVGGSPLTAVAGMDRCPTTGGKLGWARAPAVFVKPPGSTWSLLEPTVVVKTVPAAPSDPTAEVCFLPAGAQVVVRERATGGATTWVRIDSADVEQEPKASANESEGEVAASRCEGPKGQRLGWFFTRPNLFNKPKEGGTWETSYARYVYQAYPESDAEGPGPVVCALPGDTTLDIVGPPVGSGRNWWVPVAGGAIHDD